MKKLPVLFLSAMLWLAGNALAGDIKHEIERQEWDQETKVYNPETKEWIGVHRYKDKSIRTIDGNPIAPEEIIAGSNGKMYKLEEISEEELEAKKAIGNPATKPEPRKDVSSRSAVKSPTAKNQFRSPARQENSGIPSYVVAGLERCRKENICIGSDGLRYKFNRRSDVRRVGVSEDVWNSLERCKKENICFGPDMKLYKLK